MFKIFTAIDTFVVMTNIAAMFSIDDAFTRGRITLAPGAQALLDSLIKDAEDAIVSNVQAAVDGKLTSVNDLEWPNLTIIRKNFAAFTITPAKMKDPNINVVDVFNSGNGVIWSVEDYDSWGPLLSLDKEIELRKKHGLGLDTGIMEWLKYKNLDETELMDKLTDKYEDQEREVLDYEAWMTM
jgi:hypothetical protein